MRFHNRVPGLDRLQRSYCTLLHDVYTSMYSCIPTCCCACCCVVCCYTAVAAAAACCLLLLAAAVRHRVPDGKICCCGSLRLTPVFSFSSFKHDFFSMYPLTVLSHFQRRFFTYNACNTSSVLRTCAEARRALARRGGAPLVPGRFKASNVAKNGNSEFSCISRRHRVGFLKLFGPAYALLCHAQRVQF